MVMHSLTKYMNGKLEICINILHGGMLKNIQSACINSVLCKQCTGNCICPFVRLFVSMTSQFVNLFYNAGHSDVVMGAVALNDDDLNDRLRFLQNGNYIDLLVALWKVS